MEENKLYYKPDISEFHIGFRFELLAAPRIDENDGYMKTVFDDSWPIPAIKHRLDDYPMIRVKYLDKDDIIECGFEELVPGRRFRLGAIEIQAFETTDHAIAIINHDWSGLIGSITIFIGTIKNYSELKKLLKQLNIE